MSQHIIITLIITKRYFKFIEAIEAVVKYSPDELSILKRKLITREILFEYLHEKDITIPLPTTKSALIDKICNYWNLETKYKYDQIQNTVALPQPEQENTASVELMGEKFCEWFYSMLNTSPIVGSEHFWSDAKLKLNLISEKQTITEEVRDDPEKIVLLLSGTKESHNLFFNPNLTKDGMKARMDPHGLVLLMVCGTLHTDSVCVGVFEQTFGLARDPFCENNWKIKCSELNLRSKEGVVEPPKCDDSILSIMEC